jgi:AcrR family transcriptional regulator
MSKKKYHHGDLKNALIEAGIEILAKDGLGALSLREVARQAGVSHTAPYAHYTDKQALIAAIATAGYEKLYAKLADVIQRCQASPAQQLVEAGWAYLEFAFDEPDHFKITFSGVIEKEKDYPAFVEISQKSFKLVVKIIETCQQTGVLPVGPSDLIAVSVWSLLHGLAPLILEEQISHTILDRYTSKEILVVSLNLMTQVKLDPPAFGLETEQT